MPFRKRGSSSNRPDARPTDIVIPIIGDTGAGKSTFINNLLGQNRKKEHMKVGHSQSSCTTQLALAMITLNDRRVVLLDTLGFNHSDKKWKNDFDILKCIADWLKNSQMVLGGVIYLRSIPQDDRVDTISTNLRHLRALCKPSGLGKVILATTKWDQFIQNSEDKEKILRRVDWEYRRFKPKGNDAEESALGIVDAILKCVNQDDMQNLPIGRELDHPMTVQQQPEKSETPTQDRAQNAMTKKAGFITSLRKKLFG